MCNILSVTTTLLTDYEEFDLGSADETFSRSLCWKLSPVDPSAVEIIDISLTPTHSESHPNSRACKHPRQPIQRVETDPHHTLSLFAVQNHVYLPFLSFNGSGQLALVLLGQKTSSTSFTTAYLHLCLSTKSYELVLLSLAHTRICISKTKTKNCRLLSSLSKTSSLPLIDIAIMMRTLLWCTTLAPTNT